MMRIAIIGAGGIGSNVCRDMARLVRGGQFLDTALGDVTVYDFDIVENKNLMHQDFYGCELSAPKVVVMIQKYELPGKPVRFMTEHLTHHDAYLLCADNTAVRQLVYKHARAYDKPFVDMRAEGMKYAVFTSQTPLSILVGSLGADKNSKEGHSCRTPADMASGRVQMGNAAVAPIGVQYFLQLTRGDPCPMYTIGDVAGDTVVHHVKEED